MSEKTEPTLLLVHGAWHGSWAWGNLLPDLAELGLDVQLLDLPGVGRSAGRHDLPGHVDALRQKLARIDHRPVVICGHSYGGAVVTEGAVGVPNVRGLVYLAAFLLDVGESCADVNVPELPAPDGCAPELEGDYLRVSEAAARYLFYADCPPDLVADAVRRLTPEHLQTVRSPVDRAAWRDVPTTYIVCEQDRALNPEVQRRMAERADEQHVLNCGHSPMLARRAELAKLLADAVRRAA